MKMINLKVNGIAVQVPEGTTILEAAKAAKDLKLFSAVIVSVFLSIPYIKSNYGGKLAINIRREGRSNA